jgi:hypothetical protein
MPALIHGRRLVTGVQQLGAHAHQPPLLHANNEPHKL